MNRYICTIASGLLATTSAFAANNYDGMSIVMYDTLVETCHSAATDNRLEFKQTLRELRVDSEAIALNLVCNGQSVIDFAKAHDRPENAQLLSNKIGSVQIRDIAMNQQRVHVTVDI